MDGSSHPCWSANPRMSTRWRCDWECISACEYHQDRSLITHVKFQADWTIYRLVIELSLSIHEVALPLRVYIGLWMSLGLDTGHTCKVWGRLEHAEHSYTAVDVSWRSIKFWRLPWPRPQTFVEHFDNFGSSMSGLRSGQISAVLDSPCLSLKLLKLAKNDRKSSKI